MTHVCRFSHLFQYLLLLLCMLPAGTATSSAQTWNDLEENEAYTARHECSFVQAGDQFYLMGGREDSRTIDVYNYGSNTWNALEDISPSEFNHFQATEYQGLIWVIGSFRDNIFPNEEPEENIWIFNPVTEEWVQGPSIPEGRRRGSTGLSVYNNKFYISGGNTIGHAGGYVAWFDEYDPATGEWTPLADAPRPRDHFHSVVIEDRLYLAGGRLSGGTGGVWSPTIPEVDVYDFITASWSTLPAAQNIPTPRGGASAVNYNGRLLVIGGEVLDQDVYGTLTDDALRITEAYDPATTSWERLADLNSERHGTQALVSGSSIFVLAGSPARGGGNQRNMESFGSGTPAGIPLLASTLTGPGSVEMETGVPIDITLELQGGNVGEYIRSALITGPDAADFEILSDLPDNTLMTPGSSKTLQLRLNASGNLNAVLEIAFGQSSTLSISLSSGTSPSIGLVNPGNQFSTEGQSIILDIDTGFTSVPAYNSSGLPPGLSINPNTGQISGTFSDGTGSGDAFMEDGGVLIVEAESGNITPSWSLTTAGGETGIIAGSDHFNNRNGGTIPYQIQVSTPGVYRFTWNNFFSGPDSTEENDNWLRFPNDENVWFFGYRGTPPDEAFLINNLQGAQSDIVFPIGSNRVTVGTTPAGVGGNGYFKIYRSGGSGEIYDWQARTSDNLPHDVYVWFVNPGTYTMEISERSLGHAIDRIALYKVDGPDYTDVQLSALPESTRSGDGTGAAANSPYTVTVTVTDAGASPDTETIQFTWTVAPEGSLFSAPKATPVTGEAPLEVTFTGSDSTDDIGVTSYSWDFDDGSPLNTDENPQHTFVAVGTYDVSLTVEDSDGNTDTNTVTITVSAPPNTAPIALITASPLIGQAPLPVSFTGSTSTDDGGIVSYSWDFTDGGGSQDPDPDYTFLTEGTYTVQLTVTDAEGLSDSATIDIEVTAADIPPVALAEGTPVSGTAPLEVQFTGSNSTDDLGITAYAWDFTDQGATDTTADPVYTFTSPGTYEVQLTVTDTNGQTGTDTVTITVSASPNTAPIAEITASTESGQAPLQVSFTGSTSTDDGGIVSFTWDFMDGGGSQDPDPEYTFLTEGNYTVQLTVTDAEGLSDSATIDIVVTAADMPPVALAEGSPVSGTAPLEVQFTGSNSTDDLGITAYAWDFTGQGATVTTADPAYTFTSPGIYEVQLTVTDTNGQTGTDTIFITVTQEGENLPPVAVAEATPLSGTAPLEVSFTGSGSVDDSGELEYLWEFMDGDANSTDPDPVHTFTNPGSYTVRLTVTDSGGLTDSESLEIVVEAVANQAPVAVAQADPPSGSAPLEVRFTGSNSYDDTQVVSYFWDFMDGLSSSTEPDPVYTFANAGTYTVTLMVVDAEGLSDTATVSVVVGESANIPPTAIIEASTISGTAPLIIDFTGHNSVDDFGIASYTWDFGDGTSSGEVDPQHTYTEAGNYTVVLTLIDDSGLTNTATVNISVIEEDGDDGRKAVITTNPTRDGVARIRVITIPPNVEVTHIYLHDSAGRFIRSFEAAEVLVSEGSYEIPVAAIRNGLYFVGLKLDQGEPLLLKLLVHSR